MKKYIQYLSLVSFFAGVTAFPLQAQDIQNVPLSSREAKAIRVRDVITADTIKLEDGEIIKMIGVKAPYRPMHQFVQKDKDGFILENISPETPLEDRAYYFILSLLNGKDVRLEYDRDEKDEQMRTLAYVFLDDSGLLVNEEILRQGFANLSTSPANSKYSGRLQEAYQEARRERRGLHGE